MEEMGEKLCENCGESLREEYAWIDTTIDTFKYKVVSGNKMKVLSNGKWKTITVEFNEDRIKMKITPALTSMEESESWISF